MGDSDDQRDKNRTRWIVGCMTGTSLDGLDVALTEIRGSGLAMTAHFKGMVSMPLGDLSNQLRYFAEGNAAPPLDFMHAARRLGELHADAVALVCDQHLPKNATLDFVVAHGQTIWHAPGMREKVQKQESSKAENETENRAGAGQHRRCDTGMSWQLFDPWPIVRRMNVPVCFDLRQADMIAGGQGAPITPIADPILYRNAGIDMVVNLGGIMNVTLWTGVGCDGDELQAGDACPCNLLLDGMVKRLFSGETFDRDGELSGRGTAVESIWRRIETSLPVQGLGEHSLGREQCTDTLLDEFVAEFSSYDRNDVVRSALEYVIGTIDEISEAMCPEGIILAGGGARNNTLVREVQKRNLEISKVVLSDDLGIPCEAREAMGFAVLGALSQDGVPITLPQVTGAKEPGVAGVWAGI